MIPHISNCDLKKQLMRNEQTSRWVHNRVYYLAIGLTYVAIFLRSILVYQGTPYFGKVLGLLVGFLLLFLIDLFLSGRVKGWDPVYLGIQTILVSLLFFRPDRMQYDYFSVLYGILGMQAMLKLSYRNGLAFITLFFILLGIRFISLLGVFAGLINTLLFGAIIIFLSAYALSTRRAQLANDRNQSLMDQLQNANVQLESHSDTLRQLGVANERQRLRRELHDSVTQTIFSMTLTTQSALLLLDRDASRVGDQLERLNQLASSALSEMHTLISELRPEQTPASDLVTEIKKQLEGRHLPEGLSVSIQAEGKSKLSLSEEQGLFRITQEAINNVVKHAHASRITLRTHLVEPCWVEIEDDGQGFVLEKAISSGRFGLTGMRERAEEINWSLSIHTAPGKGTRIRIEKRYPAGDNL
jgi:signal transduction histidine kinase